MKPANLPAIADATALTAVAPTYSTNSAGPVAGPATDHTSRPILGPPEVSAWDMENESKTRRKALSEDRIEKIPLPGNQLRILRMKQLIEVVGVKKSTIYDWMNPNSPRYCDFPRPIKLGKSSVGWIESDVVRWLRYRAWLSKGER